MGILTLDGQNRADGRTYFPPTFLREGGRGGVRALAAPLSRLTLRQPIQTKAIASPGFVNVSSVARTTKAG